jgi:hypothetical protein
MYMYIYIYVMLFSAGSANFVATDAAADYW